MRCFIDGNRTCSDGIQSNEEPRCRMWNLDTGECLLVELAREKLMRERVMTVSFPPSAPPPEVR